MRACLPIVLTVLALSLPDARSSSAAPRPADGPPFHQSQRLTLRFRCVGCEDVAVPVRDNRDLPADGHLPLPPGSEPVESVLRELIVPVTIGIPFKRETKAGRRTFSLSGKVTASKEGHFVVEIHCTDSVESDETVIDVLGREVPVFEGSDIQTTIAVRLAKEEHVGSFTTDTRDSLPDGTEVRRVTKTGYTILLETPRPKHRKMLRPASRRCASGLSR